MGVLCNSLFLYSWLIAYVNSAVVFQAYGCGFIVLSCLCCWCLHVAWTVLRTCRLFVFCVSVGWLDGLIVGVVYVVFAFRCFGCWLTYMLFVLVTFGCLLMFWFMDINSVVAIYYAWILWFLFIVALTCFDCCGVVFVGYCSLTNIVALEYCCFGCWLVATGWFDLRCWFVLLFDACGGCGLVVCCLIVVLC